MSLLIFNYKDPKGSEYVQYETSEKLGLNILFIENIQIFKKLLDVEFSIS